MWKARSDVAWREKDRMVVILKSTTGCYYTLNHTGARLWTDLVGNNMSVAESAKAIHASHEGAPSLSQVQADCMALFERWRTEQLLEEIAPVSTAHPNIYRPKGEPR
jgi:hypothetical protein